jgi:hypothetical protein
MSPRTFSMLEFLLICDSDGLSFYNRQFRDTIKFNEPALLSGLISAIDSLGRHVFNKKVAVVTYGEDNVSNVDESISKIIVISKDLLAQDKRMNFVFFSSGDSSIKALREITTAIFIEIKSLLRVHPPDYKKIGLIVDKIIDNKYKDLIACF